MRPLNRPMFKYGGPIKEGIMKGMKEPQAINTVGSPLAPTDSSGRQGYALPLLPLAYSGLMAAGRFLAPRAIAAGAKAFGRGLATSPGTGTSAFGKGLTIGQRFKNLLPSGRFRDAGSKIPLGGTGTTKGALVPYGSAVDATGKLTLRQSLTDPRRLGMAIRENPITAFTAAGQIKNIPDIVGGGLGLAADAGLGATNYLLGTDFKRDKGDPKATGDAVAIERLDKNKTVASGDTGGDPNTSTKTDAEKQKITEDRIQETKNKYYKLMGIDKMNKEATYDSLIDASKIIQAEGGDLKGAIKSGSLQSQLISAISKNLDKSSDLKKKIDSAVLTAEIQKDINKTKMSDFDKQLAILGPEGYRKKALGETSVADMVAATKAKGTLVNSDIVSSFIESKGGKVTDTFDDTKFQKWEKNNTGKDEIDYITENFSTIDVGVYVVNGRAVQIGVGEDGKKTANYISLDTIIG
jgi:hypothetical protein